MKFKRSRLRQQAKSLGSGKVFVLISSVSPPWRSYPRSFGCRFTANGYVREACSPANNSGCLYETVFRPVVYPVARPK